MIPSPSRALHAAREGGYLHLWFTSLLAYGLCGYRGRLRALPAPAHPRFPRCKKPAAAGCFCCLSLLPGQMDKGAFPALVGTTVSEVFMHSEEGSDSALCRREFRAVPQAYTHALLLRTPAIHYALALHLWASFCDRVFFA
jgi:hypothetical protein